MVVEEECKVVVGMVVERMAVVDQDMVELDKVVERMVVVVVVQLS